jgi:hypothetical protein
MARRCHRQFVNVRSRPTEWKYSAKIADLK